MSFGGKNTTKIEAEQTKTDARKEGDSKEASTGATSEKLVLDQAAISKIIEDTLGGPGGLKDIFGSEQAAGIYDSTVASDQAGNFAAQLVGELAKITGERKTKTETEAEKDFRERGVTKTGRQLISNETEIHGEF